MPRMIPSKNQIYAEVLRALPPNKDVPLQRLIRPVGEALGVTDDEFVQRTPGGYKTFEGRLSWAMTDLKRSGLVDNPGWGVYRITPLGASELAANPGGFTDKYLKALPSYREHLTDAGNTDDSDEGAADPEQTPEETIGSAVAEINKRLVDQLIERVMERGPDFFEDLVVDLLLAMGYGHDRTTAGLRIGRSGDHGLDGIISMDVLGLDKIYVQAKRYDPSASVGEAEIRNFSGSLLATGSSKGVFITTSKFSSNAEAFPKYVSQHIVLIDGSQLAQLMIDYDIGVVTYDAIKLKRVAADYFDPSA